MEPEEALGLKPERKKYEEVKFGVDWLTDDDSIPPGHVFHQASASNVEAGEKMGRTFRILNLQKDYVVQVDLINVTEKRHKILLGPWAADKTLKEIGWLHQLEARLGIEEWAMALFTKALGCSIDEVQVFSAKKREEFKDRTIHAYKSVSVVYERNPMQLVMRRRSHVLVSGS